MSAGAPLAAVTGWAWRTPLGASVPEVVARLCAGERAAAPNARFDAAAYACTVAAVIPGAPRPSKHRKFLRRLGLFGIEAALEALAQAGVGGADRRGLFAGVGGLRAHWDDMMPALEAQRDDGAGAWQHGLRLLHPFFMLQHLSNNAHALLAIEAGARGEGVTFGGASAGAQAIAAASRALAAGAVDAAVVVAYDSLVEPETIVELAERGVATRAPAGAVVAPYDELAAGVVPGEAAAALVLEPPARAAGRALALVASNDAADGAVGAPSAATIAAALAPLARGVRGEVVVDGAAQANPQADAAEREAIADLVGASSLLTGSAAALGALGAAAAPVQVIALAALLAAGRVAPIAGLRAAAPGPLAPVMASSPTRARAALGLAVGAPGLVSAVRVETP